MKQSLLVQVNALDEPIGLIEKQEAHIQGVLHRAFSIFIFRKKGPSTQLLLQKRAHAKYHSGGLWTNTCCSHAEPNVPIEETANKRLLEEMGFSCPLHSVGSFHYKAQVNTLLTEHEIDHVFMALHDPAAILPSPEEASECRWMDITDIQKRMDQEPHTLTVWFPQAFHLALKGLHVSR